MITVYYGAFSERRQSPEYCHEPEPVLNTLFDSLEIEPNDGLRKCPAFTGVFKNTFKVKSSYDYNLTWDGKNFTSMMYDQSFFDSTVLLRESNKGIVSYLNPGIYFYADCDKLELEMTTPIYEKNMMYDGIIIPGKYDCANHFRRLECSLKLKAPQTINIHDEGTLYYVKFHTEEKIKLVRFHVTHDIFTLTNSLLYYRNHTSKLTPLDWYYGVMKKHYNKKLLKLIKQNIIN